MRPILPTRGLPTQPTDTTHRSPRPTRVAAACLALAVAAGWFAVGPLLYKLPIGLDQSAFLWGEPLQRLAEWASPGLQNAASGLIWLALGLAAIGALALLATRAAVRARASALDPGRRSLLLGAGSGAGMALLSMLAAGATGALRGLFGVGTGHGGWGAIGGKISSDEGVVKTHAEWKQAWKGSRVRAHRRLGRTGYEVSDVVLGTGRIRGEDGEQIARLAIERGVNCFDTSPDYSGAGSEQAMGRAIRGVRDRLFIATKFCTPTGHLPPGTPVAKYVEAVEGSLRRLGTDYVDVCHVHSCDEVERLMDPNVHEAFDRLREQGKVRFLGFSSHTPNLEEVARTAIDSGRFDVMMLAYHHGIWPRIGELIARARREQDMGVVAMKTLKGARHHGLAGFREQADAYSQAALKWALSNPDVSCAVISFFELQHVDEYLYASGGALGAQELAILERYDRLIAGTYCAPHCGACLDSCPEGLPIHDVLRHRMYFEDYGWEKEGMRLYARLEKNASLCAGCPAPCLGTCPAGIAIPERMGEAHAMLTLG
jgi:aryl-alcohol dehydrogenase-like predicted oxidoreductase